MISETDGQFFDLMDLMNLEMEGDDIRGLANTWHTNMLGMRTGQAPYVLGTLFLSSVVITWMGLDPITPIKSFFP